MALGAIVWVRPQERFFETGVDHGVLYHQVDGAYTDGEAWNGLTNVTAQPSGAEPNKQYADNIEYVNLLSAEQFGATIECFMAPDGFLTYDGVEKTSSGLRISGQYRRVFGFSWRSMKGNAVNPEAGYILNFAYGCQASPSEKADNTINESPELKTFSWTLSTTAVDVAGRKPTAHVSIDSTDPDIDPANLAALELILYGSPGVAPRLPLPDEIDAILSTGVTVVTPTNPTYNSATDELTIPNVAGVEYLIDGEVQDPGAQVITEDTIVTARPESGYRFGGMFVDRWFIDFS